MTRSRLLIYFLASVLFPSFGGAQQNEKSEIAASPEMDKLAKALAGEWNTTESMEKSEFFPKGGSRHGSAHIGLVAGGTTLFAEFHSNGSAGKLDGLYLIWWDKPANIYRFFVCFNGSSAPCKLRGTAHWEGDNFVNDYEEMVAGKVTKCRDSFIHITPTSNTLTAAVDAGDGTMRTLITTTNKRR
jgi:hypothetical protein